MRTAVMFMLIHPGEGPLSFQFFFFFQAEDGIRDGHVTGVQTCALPILMIGFSAGSFTTLMAAIVGRQFGARSFGLVAGMLFFSNSWTVVLLPLSAWARDSFGSYNGVWWSLMAAIVLCGLLMLRVQPRRRA